MSKSPKDRISPWAIACSKFKNTRSAESEDPRANSNLEQELQEKVQQSLLRAKTLAQKKRLYDEIYPFRNKISIGRVFDALEEQVEKELDAATTQEERRKLLKYATSTDMELEIFSTIFGNSQSHEERMKVIRKSPHGFDRWFRFVEITLERATTQAERWELARVVGGYGISSKIREEIEKRYREDLATTNSQAERLKVYKEAPKGSDISLEALRLYLRHKKSNRR